MKVYIVYNGDSYEHWVEYVCATMDVAEAYIQEDPDRWIEEREVIQEYTVGEGLVLN